MALLYLGLLTVLSWLVVLNAFLYPIQDYLDGINTSVIVGTTYGQFQDAIRKKVVLTCISSPKVARMLEIQSCFSGGCALPTPAMANNAASGWAGSSSIDSGSVGNTAGELNSIWPPQKSCSSRLPSCPATYASVEHNEGMRAAGVGKTEVGVARIPCDTPCPASMQSQRTWTAVRAQQRPPLITTAMRLSESAAEFYITKVNCHNLLPQRL